MKATVVLIFSVVAVMASPTEKPDDLSSGMSDLIAAIGQIQERVKGMRGIAAGNGFEQEITDGVKNMTKGVTYENLIERVQEASKKIQALQKKLSGAMKDLDKANPRPVDATEKPATAA